MLGLKLNHVSKRAPDINLPPDCSFYIPRQPLVVEVLYLDLTFQGLTLSRILAGLK